MTTVACEENFISQLLAENAKLKTKVGIPERERVLQETLQEYLQRFFDDAKQTLENAILHTFAALNEEEGEKSDDNRRSHRVTALVDAVRVLGAQNEALIRQLNEMQTQVVARLNEKVELLECERETLQHRVLRLEEDVAAATTTAALDEHAPPSLLAELRFLRASDAQFREQLAEIQQRTDAAAVETDKLVKNDIHASLKLPHVLEQLEKTRSLLKRAEAEGELLRLQLCESKQRECLLHELRETRLQEEVALQQSTVEKLLAHVALLEARGAEAEAAAAANLDKILQLQQTINSFYAKQTAADETSFSKRRRLEEEILEDPNSVRREYITFWLEGQEELRKMREELQQLRAKERLLRTTQEKLAQMECTRSTVTSKLVTLANDIDDARKENRSLRAQCAGLVVERDYLRSNLASVISLHMQDEELQRCCASIREAAAKSAAASSSVVADPQAIQQAMRQAQELKDEVSQLTKQKEKLHRYIALHEERIVTLTIHDALRDPATNSDCSVIENVALAELQAEDMLSRLEEAASSGTKGSVRRCEKFLDMHKRLTACEQQIEEHQIQLTNVTAERDDALKGLDEVKKEMCRTVAMRESAISDLLNSNAALTQSVSVLQSEKERLCECYNASVTFMYKLSTVLSGLFGLFRSEADLVTSLSEALAAERAEVVELTRRGGEMCDTGGGEVQQVLNAIDRMCGYIEQAIGQQQRIHTLTDTAHLCRLAEEVKRQEERLEEMQQTFTRACGELGESLAWRVSEAQKRGDVVWKQRVKALMDERQQLQAELGSEKDFLAKIERVLLVASCPKPSSIAATTTVATFENEPLTSFEMSGNNQLLDVINQLFATVSSQQCAPELEEKTERNKEEEEEKEDSSKVLKDALLLAVSAGDQTEKMMATNESVEEEVMQ